MVRHQIVLGLGLAMVVCGGVGLSLAAKKKEEFQKENKFLYPFLMGTAGIVTGVGVIAAGTASVGLVRARAASRVVPYVATPMQPLPQ